VFLSLAVAACAPRVEAESGGATAAKDGTAPPPGSPVPAAERYQGTAPPELREPPPPATPSPDWTFPKIHHDKLDNGLPLRVVERHELPIVEIRLVVLSGQASDGARPGVAVLAGELLKVGGTGKWTSRELLEKIESLGSSLDILTERDSTTLSL
jgi:zinc protease